MRYYTEHRDISVLLSVTFVIGGIALALFLGGAIRRLATGPGRGWAYTGFAGAVGITVLFASMLACEGAMSVLGTRPDPNPSAIDALWALHNSVFTVLFLAISVALLGLGRAGVATGLTPRGVHLDRPGRYRRARHRGCRRTAHCRRTSHAHVRTRRPRIHRLARLPRHHRHPAHPSLNLIAQAGHLRPRCQGDQRAPAEIL